MLRFKPEAKIVCGSSNPVSACVCMAGGLYQTLRHDSRGEASHVSRIATWHSVSFFLQRDNLKEEHDTCSAAAACNTQANFP